MKQGSTDDPFADDTDADPDPTDQESASETVAADRGDDSASTETTTPERTLPYIHARDGVKDGRTQRPVFLRDDIESGIDDLLESMEEQLGEDVYKTDVTEAAMVVAQENPDLVRDKLEEWGYGW